MKIYTEKNKKYGILLSGGLDSAVLLSILIKNNIELDIQPFTIPKRDGAMLYADPVIEHLNKKFNTKIPLTITAGNPNDHHSKQNVSAILEIIQKYNIDQLFVAINRIPEELSEYPGAPNRASYSTDSRILLPFVNMTKDEIVSLMFEEEQDELMNITHSCTEQQLGRCKVCWQCTERKWAFDKLNKIDQGKC